jgi:hypothetical protein
MQLGLSATAAQGQAAKVPTALAFAGWVALDVRIWSAETVHVCLQEPPLAVAAMADNAFDGLEGRPTTG